MNLYDLDSDKVTMNIDGKDIEMKPAICFGKVIDWWLVSKCGKVWSLHQNRILPGTIDYAFNKEEKTVTRVKLILTTPLNFWEDGSGWMHPTRKNICYRNIRKHQIIMDTWAPLYDNPPEGIEWKEWKVVRDLPNTYDFISKTVVIDHIDDDPTNNHVDNLRRVTQWDNQPIRKAKGI